VEILHTPKKKKVVVPNQSFFPVSFS